MSRWRRALGRLRSALFAGRANAPAASKETEPAPTFASACAEAGVDPATVGCAEGVATRLYGHLSPARLDRLAGRDPQRVTATIERAEQFLAHRFQHLGSEVYEPVDPDRPTRPDGYRPIDWAFDPTSSQRFPVGFPFREWTAARTPEGADIKLPWELARGQHWVTLAQAYLLTGREEFATEVVDQWLDFVEANPVGVGIQWVCTMDVAIRAANAAIAWSMVREAFADDEHTADRLRGVEALFDHAVFIRGHLEDHYEVTSNHFLSNVVGLQFVAEFFRGLPVAIRWDAFARERIAEEIGKQILPDGADFESSVPYHRLVTELFLASAELARRCEVPYSAEFEATLERAVDFLAAVERPDGLMPQIGDADDGRFHIFSDHGAASPQVGRHLLGPAGVHFGNDEWLKRSGSLGEWEAAWWGFEFPSRRRAPSTGRPADRVGHFPDAGLTVDRRHDAYLLISNGRVGTRGFGNHKHNDSLSFEAHFQGRPFIVDPGSGAYTGAPEWRNRMRSVASHNTLQVGDVEPNEFKPEWLFRMFETSWAQHLEYRSTDEETLYVGRHGGYARCEPGVWFERGFLFRPREGVLLIRDRVRGSGAHSLRWHFHLAPGVEGSTESDGIFLRADDVTMQLVAPPSARVTIAASGYSPSYGVERPSRSVRLEDEFSSSMESTQDWTFAFVSPSQWSDAAQRARVERGWEQLEEAISAASAKCPEPEVDCTSPVA